MIARLRRRHRTTVTMLFVLVSVFFGWAILARKATPRVHQPPGAPETARGARGPEAVVP